MKLISSSLTRNLAAFLMGACAAAAADARQPAAVAALLALVAVCAVFAFPAGQRLVARLARG